MPYRGRLAPSPTGFLHRGHARTFWIAQQRAEAAGGTLIVRNDDLDRARVRPEFVAAMFEDMRWLGLRWSEGPDLGGPHAPYTQSERLPLYRLAFERLLAAGLVFPCICSRKDVLTAAGAPHAGEEEPLYPGTCRERRDHPIDVNWRLRVPDGEVLAFTDGHFGEQRATAGVDFGDFLVWRKDDLPSYQLACVVDDALMGITEVVRGADLIASTFRQLLLYRALGWTPPAFFHCPLVLDETGQRLAKRDASTTLRGLRAAGWTPAQILVERSA
ncbi:MAG: tRNA glutamyl-Q(34) synthetase GluQRS [Chthoniobacteraceae bacterium]